MIDDVTLLLANSAESTGAGMVSALGMGWSITASPTAPSALVIMIKVPWDETNRPHRLRLHLITEDGRADVFPDGTPGPQIDMEFETGRPPGIAHGVPIDFAQAVTLGPLNLQPGRYVWRMDIDDHEVARRAFTVRRPDSARLGRDWAPA